MERRDLWALDPEVTFLNHGSFGACPRAVLDYQTQLREEIERRPVEFFSGRLEGLLDESRRSLADFVGADPEGLAFVCNATTAVNTVLRSFDFRPGDEILITDHEYNACRNAVADAARRAGARMVVAEVPFPLTGPDLVLDAMIARVTERTRLCVVDHVTSPTALLLPVTKIVETLARRGIPTLIDGAHGPGMLPLEIDALGADFYAGNCHKWLCTPKGSAFLWVSPSWRERVHPLVTSHGANSPRTDRSRFRLEFDWTGTADPTAFLSIPEAIRWLGSLLPGGWPELMERNHAAALEARRKLCGRLGLAVPCPDAMIPTMASIPVPDGESTDWNQTMDFDPLHRALRETFHIEVPVFAWPAPPKRLLRVSAQVYNRPEEYDRLADALVRLLP